MLFLYLFLCFSSALGSDDLEYLKFSQQYPRYQEEDRTYNGSQLNNISPWVAYLRWMQASGKSKQEIFEFMNGKGVKVQAKRPATPEEQKLIEKVLATEFAKNPILPSINIANPLNTRAIERLWDGFSKMPENEWQLVRHPSIGILNLVEVGQNKISRVTDRLTEILAFKDFDWEINVSWKHYPIRKGPTANEQRQEILQQLFDNKIQEGLLDFLKNHPLIRSNALLKMAADLGLTSIFKEFDDIGAQNFWGVYYKVQNQTYNVFVEINKVQEARTKPYQERLVGRFKYFLKEKSGGNPSLIEFVQLLSPLSFEEMDFFFNCVGPNYIEGKFTGNNLQNLVSLIQQLKESSQGQNNILENPMYEYLNNLILSTKSLDILSLIKPEILEGLKNLQNLDPDSAIIVACLLKQNKISPEDLLKTIQTIHKNQQLLYFYADSFGFSKDYDPLNKIKRLNDFIKIGDAGLILCEDPLIGKQTLPIVREVARYLHQGNISYKKFENRIKMIVPNPSPATLKPEDIEKVLNKTEIEWKLLETLGLKLTVLQQMNDTSPEGMNFKAKVTALEPIKTFLPHIKEMDYSSFLSRDLSDIQKIVENIQKFWGLVLEPQNVIQQFNLFYQNEWQKLKNITWQLNQQNWNGFLDAYKTDKFSNNTTQFYNLLDNAQQQSFREFYKKLDNILYQAMIIDPNNKSTINNCAILQEINVLPQEEKDLAWNIISKMPNDPDYVKDLTIVWNLSWNNLINTNQSTPLTLLTIIGGLNKEKLKHLSGGMMGCMNMDAQQLKNIPLSPSLFQNLLHRLNLQQRIDIINQILNIHKDNGNLLKDLAPHLKLFPPELRLKTLKELKSTPQIRDFFQLVLSLDSSQVLLALKYLKDLPVNSNVAKVALSHGIPLTYVVTLSKFLEKDGASGLLDALCNLSTQIQGNNSEQKAEIMFELTQLFNVSQYAAIALNNRKNQLNNSINALYAKQNLTFEDIKKAIQQAVIVYPDHENVMLSNQDLSTNALNHIMDWSQNINVQQNLDELTQYLRDLPNFTHDRSPYNILVGRLTQPTQMLYFGLEHIQASDFAARIYGIIKGLPEQDRKTAMSSLVSMIKDCVHCNVGTRERLVRVLQGYTIKGKTYSMDGSGHFEKLYRMLSNEGNIRGQVNQQAIEQDMPEFDDIIMEGVKYEDMNVTVLKRKQNFLLHNNVIKMEDLLKQSINGFENLLKSNRLFCYLWAKVLSTQMKEAEETIKQAIKK